MAASSPPHRHQLHGRHLEYRGSTPAPAETPRNQEPGAHGARSQVHPTHKANAGRSCGGVRAVGKGGRRLKRPQGGRNCPRRRASSYKQCSCHRRQRALRTLCQLPRGGLVDADVDRAVLKLGLARREMTNPAGKRLILKAMLSIGRKLCRFNPAEMPRPLPKLLGSKSKPHGAADRSGYGRTRRILLENAMQLMTTVPGSAIPDRGRRGRTRVPVRPNGTEWNRRICVEFPGKGWRICCRANETGGGI